MFFTIHPFILPSSFWLVHLFSHFFRETSRYIRNFCIFAQILLFGIKMLNLNRTDGKETNKRTIEPTWVSPRW